MNVDLYKGLRFFGALAMIAAIAYAASVCFSV